MTVTGMLAGAAAGGTLGYVWHRVTGCPGGACPIAGNPYLSVIWGAAMGIMFAMS